MATVYANVRITVPSERLDLLRNYFQYFTGEDFSVLEYFKAQVEQLRGTFGPDAVATIEDTGVVV